MNNIIDLPYPKDSKYPRMSKANRAAQFAPFSALTGYADAIKETSRETEKEIHLDNEMLLSLNEKLSYLISKIEEKPFVQITYFIPDEKKEGGRYETIEDNLTKFDNNFLFFCNKIKLSIFSIVKIESEVLKDFKVF